MNNRSYGLNFLFFLGLSTLAIALENDVPTNHLSAKEKETLSFEISLPAGAKDLAISISGGTGDADLYVKAGAKPSLNSYDCRPYQWGNNESCHFAIPVETTYYIALYAYDTFADVSLVASYEVDNNEPVTLRPGQAIRGLSAAVNTQNRFTIEVPNNASNLTISTTGGSGDVDLYVAAGTAPTQTEYDCRPYLGGNNESCTVAKPTPGTYHIMLLAYEAYSGVSLIADYQANSNDDNDDDNSDGDATWEGFEQYYSEVLGLSGDALLNGLNQVAARNQDRMSYSAVWDALSYTDEDPNNSNNVILLYSGRSQAKSFNASGNNDQDAWNREHAWPNSKGFPSAGDWAYTDIHHLRPTDVSINGARGNKDFDDGGSSLSEAPNNFTDNDSFEPRDEIKGDVARMMFYMAVRYNGNDNTGTDDLVLVNTVGSNGSQLGKLCTLLEWHNQDPVNQFEIDRHTRAVEVQGNRNPFIDYPTWANEIWSASCN